MHIQYSEDKVNPGLNNKIIIIYFYSIFSKKYLNIMIIQWLFLIFQIQLKKYHISHLLGNNI